MTPLNNASDSKNAAPFPPAEGQDSSSSTTRPSALAAAGLRTVVRWLLSSTRTVLGPVAASTLARLVDQILGIVLFVIPAVLVTNLVMSSVDCGCVRSVSANVGGLLTVMVGTALLKGLARYLEQYWGHLVAFKALELLRNQAYRAIYPQAPAIVTDNHSGELMARLTNCLLYTSPSPRDRG